MGNSFSMTSTVLHCYSYCYSYTGWATPVVVRPESTVYWSCLTLGPWLRIDKVSIQKCSSLTPSRRSRLSWCDPTMCTEHWTTGGSSGCYLLKEPVHKDLEKIKSTKCRKCLHNTASQWTWNSWNFHPTCEGDTLLPESLSTKSRIRSSSSDKDCLQENKISTSETLFVYQWQTQNKASNESSRCQNCHFKPSLNKVYMFHASFTAPFSRAWEPPTRKSLRQISLSVCKCISLYWNVWNCEVFSPPWVQMHQASSNSMSTLTCVVDAHNQSLPARCKIEMMPCDNNISRLRALCSGNFNP